MPNGVLALGLGAVVAALLADRRVARRGARLAAGAALVPIAFLAVRSSPWLTVANLAAATTLVALAIVGAHDGRLARLGPGSIATRLARAAPDAWSGPRALGPLVPRTSARAGDRLRRAALAALVAVPVVGAITLLLASADPVFAALLTPDVAIGPAIGHVTATVALSIVALGIVGAAATRHADDHRPAGTVGALEAMVVLGLTALVLGLFVAAQLVATTAAGRRLVTDAGLTPADYARSGFFQLCWATAIVLVLLALLRRVAAPDALARRGTRLVAGAVPLLALGLVAVALRRMALYDEAFGMTMLRLWVLGATVWMGLVLVLVGIRNLLGVGRWVGATALVAAVALVVVADVADPEAFVVHRNVSRAEAGAPLDVDYFDQLSADAVPALLAAADEVGDPRLAAELRDAARCDVTYRGVDRTSIAARRAEAARAQRCPTDGP